MSEEQAGMVTEMRQREEALRWRLEQQQQELDTSRELLHAKVAQQADLQAQVDQLREEVRGGQLSMPSIQTKGRAVGSDCRSR